MHFGNPQLLWLLLAWPALAWLGWWSLARRRRLVQRMGESQVLERLYPEAVRVWRRRRVILWLAVLALLTVAAARPQYGRIERAWKSMGTHVLIALDCSPSMAADDVIPNRLERAKRSVRRLMRDLRGNRVGIVAFAGVGLLQCPMTLDHSLALLVLDAMDTETIGVPGTDLGAAIRVAVDAFERGTVQGGRALVLITDGEDHQGAWRETAREAAEKGVHIYAIGIGTDDGSTLRNPDQSLKEDSEGHKVNTRLDMGTLQELASITNGAAFEAGGAPARVVEAISRMIQNQEKSEFESKRHTIYQDRFDWFLVPALFLIVWLLLNHAPPTKIS